MTTYLFDSKQLYPKAGSVVEVEPLTLVCHNVKYKGKNFVGTLSWEFQIVGKDEWYVTNYDWALVLNTEENLAKIKERNHLRKEANELESLAKKAHKQVLNIGSKL